MTVTFRRDRQAWRYNFQIAGKRHSGHCLEEDGTPCTSRRAAEQAERRARVAVEAAARRPAPMPTVGYTLAQGLAAYAAQADQKSANWQNRLDYMAELVRFFGAETQLAAITTERIWEYVAFAREQKVRVYVGGGKKAHRPGVAARRLWKDGTRTRSDSTINRYLDCLRKTLSIAHASRDALGRRRLEDMPAVPELTEPQALPRPIGDADIRKLLEVAAPHVAEAMALSVLLGLRRAEAYGLTIDHVDRQQRGVWLAAAETKANRAEFLPANAAAMQLLERLVAQAEERGIRHLVAWRKTGKHAWAPIRNPKRAIAGAMKRAGLTGKHRFHDLKASYTTALAHVAPGKLVQKLARHRNFATTERYILVADEATRAAVEAVADRAAVKGLDLAKPIGKVAPENRTQTEGRPRRKKLSA